MFNIFVTSCYVIFSLSMDHAMDIFMITLQDVTKPRENCNLKLANVHNVGSYGMIEHSLSDRTCCVVLVSVT